MKHRYVKGYHKGLELYGQSAERLQDRRLRDSLGRLGLVVMEGMNDVIRLNELGVAEAVAEKRSAAWTVIWKRGRAETTIPVVRAWPWSWRRMVWLPWVRAMASLRWTDRPNLRTIRMPLARVRRWRDVVATPALGHSTLASAH